MILASFGPISAPETGKNPKRRSHGPFKEAERKVVGTAVPYPAFAACRRTCDKSWVPSPIPVNSDFVEILSKNKASSTSLVKACPRISWSHSATHPKPVLNRSRASGGVPATYASSAMHQYRSLARAEICCRIDIDPDVSGRMTLSSQMCFTLITRARSNRQFNFIRMAPAFRAAVQNRAP